MAPTVAEAPPLLTAPGDAVQISRQASALPVDRTSVRRHWIVLGLLWTLALGWVAATAANFHRTAVAADRLEALYRAAPENTVGRGECARFEASQPPTMFDPDGMCWIDLTRRQVADGAVRPHFSTWDNTPYGRERHWSSSFSGWLLAVGWVAHLFTGLPLADAVAHSAAWANPILLALFLTALGLVLGRRLEAWSTGIFLVSLATLYGVEWDFSYGRPDHHGLHLMAFLGLVLGALAGGLGWVRQVPDRDASPAVQGRHLTEPRTLKEARAWFTVSGVCGGVGLWIGSTQQMVCIAVLGTGAVLGALLFAGRARPADASRFDPALWLLWSRVGATTSLFFYALEYFPSHLAMHLEINNPLIALGWLGAGEWMYLLLLARTDGAALRARPAGTALRGGLGLMAMAATVLAFIWGPATWCLFLDPLVLHETKIVGEGQPWLRVSGWSGAVGQFWHHTGALTLALPLSLVLLAGPGRKLPPWHRSALAAMLCVSGAFLVATLLQTRWVGFMETSLAVLALTVAPCVPVPVALGRRAFSLPLVWLALAVPGWAAYASIQAGALKSDALAHANALCDDTMADKEAGWNLKLYGEKLGLTRPPRVMSPFADGPGLHYYGGADTVGSFYWENVPGTWVALHFFLDDGNARARQIARERDLDFVLVISRPVFVLQMQWLSASRTDPAAARRTLAYRLANPAAAQAPPWLEELPLLDAPMARAQGMRLYRVVKDRW